MARRDAEPLFYEEQPLRVRRLRWRLAILPLFLTTLAIAQVGFGRQLGPYPVRNGDLMFFAILLWIVYVWLTRVRLMTEVTAAGLTVGLRGLLRRERVSAAEWVAWTATAFDARRDFGGYGIRRRGSTSAYIAGGTRGVRIELRNGRVLVVGSERPADLAAALDRATRGRRR